LGEGGGGRGRFEGEKFKDGSLPPLLIGQLEAQLAEQDWGDLSTDFDDEKPPSVKKSSLHCCPVDNQRSYRKALITSLMDLGYAGNDLKSVRRFGSVSGQSNNAE
jgi:hypothetical protein